jgi:hypothetical protein
MLTMAFVSPIHSYQKLTSFAYNVKLSTINRWGSLCVNIDVASTEEANYGIFPSSEVKCTEKSLAA